MSSPLTGRVVWIACDAEGVGGGDEPIYEQIVGVPLTPWRRESGGLLVKVDDGAVAVAVDPPTP